MGTPCPPPTFSVQVSLATGFAAAVASSFTYKPKGMTDEGNFGCHFNPAVTLALALRGKLRPLRAAALILAQLFASVLAAALVTAVVGLRCLQQDFDMMTQEMSPPASRVLLQAILNLLIILVALWSHERQGSMSVPVFVGFSYIAVSLVGLQQLGFDLPNILRSFGPPGHRGEELGLRLDHDAWFPFRCHHRRRAGPQHVRTGRLGDCRHAAQ